MTPLEREIVDWADGRWPERDVAGRLRKIGEEFGELAEAVAAWERSRGARSTPRTIQEQNENAKQVALEAADMAILLTDLVFLMGLGGLQLWMTSKFNKVREEYRTGKRTR